MELSGTMIKRTQLIWVVTTFMVLVTLSSVAIAAPPGNPPESGWQPAVEDLQFQITSLQDLNI